MSDEIQGGVGAVPTGRTQEGHGRRGVQLRQGVQVVQGEAHLGLAPGGLQVRVVVYALFRKQKNINRIEHRVRWKNTDNGSR